MDELTKEFLVESREGLDRMERGLTELEVRPGDAELLGEIFRAVHTIKGTTGFLALPRLEKVSHAGESLLSDLRNGTVYATTPVINTLLDLLDRLRSILATIELTSAEGDATGETDVELIADLLALRAGSAGAKSAEDVRPASMAAEASAPASGEQTLRVDVETLNRMMNLVGELVLTRNQIVQASQKDDATQALTRRLDTVTSNLRESVMRARTQPVGQLFQKFPRLVRDLAQTCGRCVRLEFAGEETRLDKSLLEALKDPLTHAIRNAIDHGIEAPADRVRVGKALEGTVRLSAFHQGGQVVLEVSDDGRGIDRGRVVARAVERKLISAERGETMTDAEAQQLVFTAGFSTRDEVTLVSGRGVGMDVVRSNVEGVGGVVEMESKAGAGSTLRMRVPLTLAIVPALIVQCGGAAFAIPRTSVDELLVVPRSKESSMLQYMGETPLLRLREELLPLLSLNELLEVPRVDANGYYVAVVRAGAVRFGLIVDDLMDPQEIVVKPIPAAMRMRGVFAGATILGSGELALILDVSAVAGIAKVVVGAGAPRAMAPVAAVARVADSGRRMLVYEDVRGRRTALLLATVERIERVAAANVEFCDGAAYLQYRGGVLALEDAEDLVQSGAERITIVICHRAGSGAHMGIVVQRVIDIAEEMPLDAGVATMTKIGDRLTLLHSREKADGRVASASALAEAA